jgi:ATP-dependent exoDNAse (exonuclease V) alpha subunit
MKRLQVRCSSRTLPKSVEPEGSSYGKREWVARVSMAFVASLLRRRKRLQVRCSSRTLPKSVEPEGSSYGKREWVARVSMAFDALLLRCWL